MLFVGFFILTFAGGIFCGQKPPTCDSGPSYSCSENEHYTRNDTRCIRTCANKALPISNKCKPFTGCVCDGDLVRRNDDASGPCVPEQKCTVRNYPKNPKRQVNTAHAETEASTAVTQEKRTLNGKSLSSSSAKASSFSKSSASSPFIIILIDFRDRSCPKHEHYTRNYSRCIRTCANKDLPISKYCKPFTGCVCDGNLVRLNDDASGPCVPAKKCRKRCTDPNAVYKDCLNPCPLTCDKPNPRPCPTKCSKGGCECASGFVLNEDTGRCVRREDCPAFKCKDPNAIYKSCPNPCPLSCDQPFPKRVCTKACLEFGCECASGFILDPNGKCVSPEDCPIPISCPKHSHYVLDDNQCPKTCGNRLLSNGDVAGACVPYTGCICNPGFVRKYDNATGPCIPERQCPPIPKHCGINEVRTSCRTICPPQKCESLYTKFLCVPTDCEPGCDCVNGYLRNKYGVCIPIEDCLKPEPEKCGLHEIWSDCAITCPPQSCESLYTTYLCAERNCTPGCNCIDGYLRNSLKVCVPSEECANDPAGCNGDLNATRVNGCSDACPPTCENPDPKVCPKICKLNGCDCKPEYIRSKRGGNCIDPRDCPGGSPKCEANQTYVGCKIGCPTNYCPSDDSRAQVACSISYPCKGGCACKAGHLIVSRENPQCVLAQDCPEVECKRPNEVWDRNPSNCFLERCEDRGTVCDQFNPYPGPRCVCKKGFYRNDSDICIPVSECPPLSCKGDFNATLTKCPTPCPKTCADPNAGSEGCIEICLPDDCECNPGYVLTKKEGGVCIKLEDCPEIGCKGDLNATYSECTSMCPQTCADPIPKPCIDMCGPAGCQCKPGYVKKEDGKCVKPEDCPVVDEGCNGDLNATYQECPSACPVTCENRHNINRANLLCPAVCDPSFCVCKKGYILTKKHGKCVKPKDCPVLGCGGDPNAEESECPSACQATCEKPDSNQPCTKECLPKGCVCKPGFIRIEKGGKCIKPDTCPVPGCGGDPHAVYKECPSACEPTCANPKPEICIMQCMPSGCVCKPGYVQSKKGGKCIKPEECPGVGCKGDLNATYTECTSMCPLTCADPNPKPCIAKCGPAGCQCNSGFVRKDDGKCVKPEDCPAPGCGGDPNAEESECPSACQATCEKPDSNQACTKQCLPKGCVCKPGFIRIKKGGKCIKPETCPVPGCGGDPHAVYKECPSACEPTCANPKPEICTMQCMPSGCVCKPGYVQSKKGGKCIKPEECPGVGCKGDLNATYTECTSMCPLTCADPNPKPCIAKCGPAGCQCNLGYVTNDDGKCVKPEDCPAPGCGGDPNAEESECPSACQATCEKPDSNQACTKQCLPKGCVCKPGFIRIKKGGKCIKPETCPVPGCGGDPHAVYKECPSACEPTCANPKPEICTMQCMPSGCVCKPGYVQSKKGGKCIKPEECPEVGCKGDLNATYTECTSMCPLTCADQNPKPCIAKCGPAGCQCNPGYIRKEDGKCVKPEDCPVPGCGGDPNAEESECPSACQATCEKPDSNQPCTKQCLPKGCVCKPGFIRIKKGGKCIKPETCPVPGCGGDPHAIYKECPSACEPTCANPKPEICTMQCMPSGCVCKPGYVQSKKGGKCIKPEECPDLCNGDRNATFSESPISCPPTCKHPDFTGLSTCTSPGCVCNQGYLLNKQGGRCIKPEDCPGGWPTCQGNETYVYCKVGCPTNYCPVDDSLAMIACDPAFPCPGGCACKAGYLMISEDDERCILSSECPEVKCTRPNEVWDANPPGCLRERCNDRDIPCDFQFPGSPRCRCIKGYFRDQDDNCVPENQCPCPISDKCKRTCAAPNPPDCVYNPPQVNMNGCDCKDGYILSEIGGNCIPIDQCPPEIACDGDANARPKRCPKPCPSTCDSPNQYPCKRMCDPIACECKPGFIRSNDTGLCILPEKCPGGNPCGKNEHFVACKLNCREFFCPVDDNRDSLFCEPPPVGECLSGCVCDLNHKRKSLKNQTCIESADCPPIKCTRPNEEWCPCPSGCLAENCEDINNQPTVCNSLVLNCDPRCICKKGHFRNSSGICIPAGKCPKPKCGYNEEEVSCRQICPPQNCEIAYTDYACTEESKICEPGCNCLPGHLRNGSGICIPNEECPYPSTPVCGINEIARDCKRICPPQTCLSKYALFKCMADIPCEPGCDCIPNYLRDDKGICIPSEKCPPPKPVCGYNEVAVPCRQKCPPQNCDIAYTEYACPNESKICEPGCDCLPNHLRNASGICVPNEECTSCQIPDKCKRTCAEPNPSNCEYNPPKVNMNGCDCKEGYILSKLGGDCIPIDQCPPEIACHGDSNARPKLCPKPCPSTCKSPNEKACKRKCDPIGCQCKPGYILSNGTGLCILPQDCPGGNPCGKKARFVDCKTDCPGDYCPVDDNRDFVFCDPPAEKCLSGCICTFNHRLKSRKDRRCIVASDCPPVNCTRPNEKWSSCPSACLAENCEDVTNQPTVCYPLILNCNPKCICKENHFRNSSGICIPAKDCPIGCNGDPNAVFTECLSSCEPTCDNPYPEACTADCKGAGCMCKQGFVLNKKNGKCVQLEDCPGCGGDPNAIYKDNPSGCEPTCSNPIPPKNCTKKSKESGCVCKRGFVLNEEDGKCIHPESCPDDCS